MSIFMVKSLLALLFILAAGVSFLSMMTLMGKQDKKTSPAALRKIHKMSGLLFFLITALLSLICIKYWIQAGDLISHRASFHTMLSFALVIILVIKILIVRFFKQFLRLAPTLGMIILVLAFVVFSTSAGFYLLRTAAGPIQVETSADATGAQTETRIKGNIQNGKILFAQKCSACHFADKEDTLFGPGFAGFFQRDKLPVSGRNMTEENFIKQIREPVRSMPAFPGLSGEELADIIAYIKTF